VACSLITVITLVAIITAPAAAAKYSIRVIMVALKVFRDFKTMIIRNVMTRIIRVVWITVSSVFAQ
jgi:hypothetical protein